MKFHIESIKVTSEGKRALSEESLFYYNNLDNIQNALTRLKCQLQNDFSEIDPHCKLKYAFLVHGQIVSRTLIDLYSGKFDIVHAACSSGTCSVFSNHGLQPQNYDVYNQINESITKKVHHINVIWNAVSAINLQKYIEQNVYTTEKIYYNINANQIIFTQKSLFLLLNNVSA